MTNRLFSPLVLLLIFTLICPAQIFALTVAEETIYRDFLQSMATVPMCSIDINQDSIIAAGETAACSGGVCPIGAEECTPTNDPACPADNPNCKPPTAWTCQSDPSLACAALPEARTIEGNGMCLVGTYDPALNACVTGWKVALSGSVHQPNFYDIYVDPADSAKLCTRFFGGNSAKGDGSCLTFSYDNASNSLNTTGKMWEWRRWTGDGKIGGIDWYADYYVFTYSIHQDLTDTAFTVSADKKVTATGTAHREDFLQVVGNGNRLEWYNVGLKGSIAIDLVPITTPAQNFTYTVPSCSPNACVTQDLSDLTPPEPKQYGGKQDDGARDSSGGCLDELLIFNGKAGECFKPSLATAWYNCCKPVPAVEKPDGLEVGEGVAAAMAAVETAGSVAAALQGAAMTGLGPVAIGALVVMVAMELVVTGCPAEGFEVASAKGAERSVYIGSYCVHDSIFGCLQSAEVHCTFASTLGRIMHEQGRPQLKRFIKSYDAAGKPIVDWGTVDKPLCEGFKAAEFQALDFSQIDMSEFFDDVQAKATKNLEGAKEKFKAGVEDFYDDLER